MMEAGLVWQALITIILGIQTLRIIVIRVILLTVTLWLLILTHYPSSHSCTHRLVYITSCTHQALMHLP